MTRQGLGLLAATVLLLGAFVAGAVMFLGGCGKAAPQKKELVILCGSSFIPPTEALIAGFKAKTGITATFTTGGSEDLLPNVKAKSIGDIFITHDPYLDYTKEAGACADQVEVGFVAPVLAVQKGNPKKIQKVEDLAQPGLKVALSDPKGRSGSRDGRGHVLNSV